MKKGFTLQEVLITLAIVGIIAAITIPGFRSIMPSKDEIQLKRAYSALTNIIADAIETNQYNTSTILPDGTHCTDSGILTCPLNTGTPPGNLSNSEKLRRLARQSLGANENANGDGFITADGTEWSFTDNNDNTIALRLTAGRSNVTQITIDMDGGITIGSGLQAIISSQGMSTQQFRELASQNPDINILENGRTRRVKNGDLDDLGKMNCMAIGQKCNGKGGRDRTDRVGVPLK